ncbi:UvrD-helicase domain-containing protein [Lysobacter enzymogenes]|uniref:UvrD-helicase domain-containing protein n=1 Tax=Lysobacter enzymogenes TaxID=69 RepID=UPI001A9718FA|nr:UvrD-helicase domain-containing protein [Lysobacter enzymogenes]QQP97957.1 UvrD-helicase domain-containing protein [Lysobacter enzymogenes]
MARKEWSPSLWGKCFTGSKDWVVTLDGARLDVSVEGRRFTHELKLSSPLIAKQGIFWTALHLKVTGQPTVELDGIPNVHGQAIVASIQAVLRANQAEIDRQREAERLVDRRAYFDREVAALKVWRARIRETVAEHDRGRRWVTRETIQALEAVRPAAIYSALKAMVAEPDIQGYLGGGEGERLSDAYDCVAWAGADLPAEIAKRNEAHLQRELVASKALLDRVESRPLNPEQARAVLCFDNRVQVVASAGSGKTSTMVAKAAYAIERGLVAPNKILMLAFNDAAAKELKARAQLAMERIGRPEVELEAMTFHKFGSKVIGQASHRRRVPNWVKDRDIEVLGELVAALKKRNRGFRQRWDLFRTVFGRGLPGFGVEQEHEDYSRSTRKTGFKTLNGEVVKSLEEVMIADWLFYNGVNYQYEPRYRHPTADRTHVQYHPDFYYPDIGLYHEHFALNERGHPPEKFPDYMQGVHWKRATHARMRTDFIETTSASLRSGKAFDLLTKALTERGLKLDPKPDRPSNGRKPIEDPELVKLMRSFICHAKSNNLSLDALKERVRKDKDAFAYRHKKFLGLYETVRHAWDTALAEEDGIDFEDMLNWAAEHLETGLWVSPYELVLADEFQDASWAQARLVQALVNAPGRYLLAVGDDWQSINRFAGADVSVMTGFEHWCGRSQVLRLEETFRCPQALCDAAGGFIAKNPNQIPKTVRSATRAHGPVLQAFQVPDARQVKSAVDRYLADLYEQVADGRVAPGKGGKVSVFVLGRYQKNRVFVPGDWQKRFGSHLTVSFHTIHGSKGLEADYVVLPDMTRRGFPNERGEDPVLALAMPSEDTFPLAEERRLFYVALTRARRSVAMFTVEKQFSVFLTELMESQQLEVIGVDGEVAEIVMCRKCKHGVMVERSGSRGLFLSCSNFPGCAYSCDVMDVSLALKSIRK